MHDQIILLQLSDYAQLFDFSPHMYNLMSSVKSMSVFESQ